MEKIIRFVDVILIICFFVFIAMIGMSFFDLIPAQISNIVVVIMIINGVPLGFLRNRLDKKCAEKAKQEAKDELDQTTLY